MPNLDFNITGVEAVARGLTPLLHFKTRITSASDGEPIQGLLLSAQIQLECPQRTYSQTEQAKLTDLFGRPEIWGRTMRNRLWAHSNATVGSFNDTTETILPVGCTYDLNVAATKYFYALEAGDVSLLFLFSGSVFFTSAEGRLQIERISWNKECRFRFPVQKWKELMEEHFPNSAWLSLRRDVFDKLCEFKRRNGSATWEQTVEQLLDRAGSNSDSASQTLPRLDPVTGFTSESPLSMSHS